MATVLAAIEGFSVRQAIVFASIIVLLLLSNALHEAGHALVAWWAGDRREEIRRRITLNPLNHVHWFLTIVLPILSYWLLHFAFGGAKPVMVDAERIGPRKMALVAMAGPAGNAIFGVICAIVTAALMAFGVIDEVNAIRSPVYNALIMAIWFSATLTVLNLVPLPPADGSRIAAMFMPAAVRRVYYALAPVTVVLLIALMLWASGALYQFLPFVGRGYPGAFLKTETWVQDQVFALVDPIKRLVGR